MWVWCDVRGVNVDEGDDVRGVVMMVWYVLVWVVGGGKGRARDAGCV